MEPLIAVSRAARDRIRGKEAQGEELFGALRRNPQQRCTVGELRAAGFLIFFQDDLAEVLDDEPAQAEVLAAQCAFVAHAVEYRFELRNPNSLEPVLAQLREAVIKNYDEPVRAAVQRLEVQQMAKARDGQNGPVLADGRIDLGRRHREIYLDANNPKFMYHAIRPPVQVFSEQEQAALGPDWSEVYIHQEYPKCKHHWSGKTITVKDSAEEAALGGGWADTLAAFEPYKSPRRAKPEQSDPIKWVDSWMITGVSADLKIRIKAQLKMAHGVFWKAPGGDSAITDSMRSAFDGIAQVLFDAGVLTEELLGNSLPTLVWDSAIAGGWWHLASETPQNIFPEKLGHYWVWLDESRDWHGLFRGEIGDWEGKLLETTATNLDQVRRGQAPQPRPASGLTEPATTPRPRVRRRDDQVEATRQLVKQMRKEGLTHQQICGRLGDHPRPIHAAWRHLPWPTAYLQNTSSVKKWLSAASK